MHHIYKLSLALIFVSCLFGSAFSTCYLAPTGLDANNCTQFSPCQSINYCLSTISGTDNAFTISLLASNTTYGICGVDISSQKLQNVTSLSIEGDASNPSGVTIDCYASDTYHMQLSNTNATISLSYISFRNGNSDMGGCVSAYNVKSLVVKNAEFTGCSANHGGAIFAVDTAVSILNSNFTSNTGGSVDGYGGALYLSPPANGTAITNCIFQKNIATYGAAIYLQGDYLTLTDSDISLNGANQDGAGLYLFSLTPTNVGEYNFQGSKIYNNTAIRGAGLFSLNLNHTWNVFGANFESNTAVTTADNPDANVACNNTNSPFCTACKADDCSSACVADEKQSCSLSAKGTALCYSTKFGTCTSLDCKCKAALSTIAKMLLVMICVCLIVGTTLILVGVVRFILKKRASKNSYTPIK